MNTPVAVVAILGSMLGLSACATTFFVARDSDASPRRGRQLALAVSLLRARSGVKPSALLMLNFNVEDY